MLPIYNNGRKSNTLQNESKKGQTVISEVCSDYLSSSTIHGISYLAGKDRHLIEKTWWIIGLILSASACTYFINKTWTKWVQNPVIVSFAPDDTSIWEIPFPAVTVCPLNKVKESVFNYTAYHLSKYNESLLEDLWNITENRKKFWDISFICDSYIRGEPENITDEDVVTNIKMVSPTLEDTMSIPKWPDPSYNGSFAQQITSEGLCFTANALGHYDMYTEEMKEGVYIIEHDNSTNTDTTWSIENGYSTTDEETSYPVRTTQAGYAFSLAFELFAAVDDRSKFCGDDVAGYKMVLHNPAEIPRISESYFLIPVNQKVIVAVTPKVIQTSKSLIGIHPHTRNCYFAHEKKLRYFKIYTQYNCKTECLANMTRQYCGCLPFYLPRDNNTDMCGYGKIACLFQAEDLQFKYINMAKKNKIDTIEESEKIEYEIFKQCDCLKSCNYIDYEAAISQAEYIYDELYPSDRDREYLDLDKTPIDIFFKESQFLALERSELYGQTDFIANIGGLLGLCMGFSFLSLLEMVYFISLRIWCKIYHKNKTNIAHNSETRIVWLE